MECTKPRATQPKQPWQKLFLPLCCPLAPVAEGPLAPTLLGADAMLSAFLLLILAATQEAASGLKAILRYDHLFMLF